MCFYMEGDFEIKEGQIIHLDRDRSNFAIENLAYICLPHHNLYDTEYSQTRHYKIDEIKDYRTYLYQAFEEWRESSWPVEKLPLLTDVPELSFVRPLNPTPILPGKGIQLTDVDLDVETQKPLLYLLVYFKTSRYFGNVDESERWLFLEAHMRFALSMRIQVRAWHQRDIDEMMSVLRGDRDSWELSGPRSGLKQEFVGDQFQVWREGTVNRLMLSTYTPTFAGISIHARLSDEVREKFSQYLEDVGFAKELNIDSNPR